MTAKIIRTAMSPANKVIRISGIKANELGSSIKINLTVDGVSGYYISYSPMTYCYKVLYLYNEAAQTYNA